MLVPSSFEIKVGFFLKTNGEMVKYEISHLNLHSKQTD